MALVVSRSQAQAGRSVGAGLALDLAAQAWEAGLAILEGRDGGFWVHTQAVRTATSAVTGSQAAADMLAFDAESYGPIDETLAAGGIAWRINVFQGDWRTPAQRYKDWLWSAYGLAAAETLRRPWFHEIKLAVLCGARETGDSGRPGCAASAPESAAALPPPGAQTSTTRTTRATSPAKRGGRSSPNAY